MKISNNCIICLLGLIILLALVYMPIKEGLEDENKPEGWDDFWNEDEYGEDKPAKDARGFTKRIGGTGPWMTEGEKDD